MAGGRASSICLAVLAPLLAASAQADADILSSKRGFADVGANYNNLQATAAGWYYTWGTGPANPGTFDAKFYPMFWNAPSQTTINNVKAANPIYVLGFNEPERPDQANMTVAQAISSWTTISNSFTGTTTKLVSPAVADTGGAAGGQQWLANFMSQATANGLKVDAVAFHWYGVSTPSNPSGAAQSFLGRVDSYHDLYDKPVFITEFAIHDWGGNYTDAEIIEANRQFLNTVIPGLEARSYVAGYSWYHWFSDAPLYSGSPSKPTPMAYSYVGAVGSGTVANIVGQNLGEHVAYLTGGELTMSNGSLGTVRYINALANTSSISGTIDWGLSGTNWVRIQPGATLRKSGPNQITFSSSVTNNGVLEVSQGSLRIGVAVTGTGSARVKGGTLALTSSGSLNTAPLIDVRGGGTLDVSALASPLTISSGRTLSNERNGTVIGNVTAATGATVSGGGIFTGNLTAQSGSVVRVGRDGLGVASRYVIDNFESYALGDVKTVAMPPWTAHQDTSLADIESFNGNKVLTFGWATDFRGVSRSLPDSTIIDNDETATFFFRINSKTDDPDHSFGLGDRASTGTVDFADFEAQLRMKQGAAGTFALDARNGSGFSTTLASGLALNTWYNIWMVVNQATDKYDIYMSTGSNAAGNKLNATALSFRNGTTNELNTILGLAGAAPIDNGVRIDDLIYQAGLDLTNPTASFDPGLVWTAETLTVGGNYTQNAGATLQLNMSSPSNLDVLHVSGQANLAGTLNVTFAIGAAGAQIGNVYHILDASSISGEFSTLQLPLLGGTLAWDSSQLYSTGSLSIFSGLVGDFTQDGVLNVADIVGIMTALADLNDFKSDHGLSNFSLQTFGDVNHDGQLTNADIQALIDLVANAASGGGGAASAIPEPGSLLLMSAGMLVFVCVRRNALRPLRAELWQA